MQVNTEDITVPWGRNPDPLDVQMGRWRMAVYQDVQESIDTTKLYFLYDPVADENSGTSGGRKGNQCLVIFDTYKRCFTHEIPLYFEGVPKFLFSLKCPSPSGGSSFIVASATENYGQTGVLLYRINLTQDGMNLENQPQKLISNSIPVSDSFIISMREDAPEVVLMTSPGLTIWRINCLVNQPSSPTESFSIPDVDLGHYYDAYLSQGCIYFLSSSPDGHFDASRVHILEITGDRRIRTQMCSPDPQRGSPSSRKQAAIDSTAGYILLAGGEIDYGNSVSRLVDYWVLNLSTFTWQQVPAQMPIQLIEPRLTAANSGNVYLWGDFDQPLPGIQTATHLRILKLASFGGMKPPPYDEAVQKPTTPPYPQQGPYPTIGNEPSSPYPNLRESAVGDTHTVPTVYPNQSSYPQPSYHQNEPQYPHSSPYVQSEPNYPQQGYGLQPSYQGDPRQNPYDAQPYGAQGGAQHAYYPPQENKNCTIQ